MIEYNTFICIFIKGLGLGLLLFSNKKLLQQWFWIEVCIWYPALYDVKIVPENEMQTAHES